MVEPTPEGAEHFGADTVQPVHVVDGHEHLLGRTGELQQVQQRCREW